MTVLGVSPRVNTDEGQSPKIGDYEWHQAKESENPEVSGCRGAENLIRTSHENDANQRRQPGQHPHNTRGRWRARIVRVSFHEPMQLFGAARVSLQ